MDEFGGSFLGSSLPEEVKALSKLLRSDPPVVDDGALRAIMKHALSISVGGAVQSKEAVVSSSNRSIKPIRSAVPPNGTLPGFRLQLFVEKGRA